MCSCGLMMNPYGALPTAFGGMRGEARWNAAYHFRDNRVGTSKGQSVKPLTAIVLDNVITQGTASSFYLCLGLTIYARAGVFSASCELGDSGAVVRSKRIQVGASHCFTGGY